MASPAGSGAADTYADAPDYHRLVLSLIHI